MCLRNRSSLLSLQMTIPAYTEVLFLAPITQSRETWLFFLEGGGGGGGNDVQVKLHVQYTTAKYANSSFLYSKSPQLT